MLKGGTKSFGVVFTGYLEVLAILKGGRGTKSFHALKGEGAQKVLPCLEGGGGGTNKFYPVSREGGGHKKFRAREFPIL